MDLFEFTQGDTPLIINVPHAGVFVPDDIGQQLNEEGRLLRDTDWHIPKLYGVAADMGATVLAATHSRYVVDLNRPPDGASLYPGQTTTSLCAVETFQGDPLYLQGREPDANEIGRRVQTYWVPYHHKLRETISSTKEKFGYVVLWDAHSINNRLPRLFDGRLSDLNFGTYEGRSCSAALVSQLSGVVQGQSTYDFVFDGRFKGGYITRNYGSPIDKIHAIQLELSQETYMDQDPPFDYLPKQAERFTPILEKLLMAAMSFEG